MIIAKSNISFLVSIFNALKDLPVNQFPAEPLHLALPNATESPDTPGS